MTTRRGTESKAINTGPGGGAIGVATASNVQFSGNSMIVNMHMVSGGRRITATSDGSYSSCSATVINGREGNKAMGRQEPVYWPQARGALHPKLGQRLLDPGLAGLH